MFEEKFGHAVLGKGHTPADHEQILRAIHRLNLNHSIVESIGDKFGITILNVIQPIPLYGVGHKTSHVPRKALNFGDHINSGAAYRLMFESDRKSFQPNSKTLNLADLSIEEGMYVDTVHYSPKFNQEIAYKIHTKLSRLLK